MYWNHETLIMNSPSMCWIVTLDVLKSYHQPPLLININRWIVTLDVLKYHADINAIIMNTRWIVTLDVLKSRYL